MPLAGQTLISLTPASAIGGSPVFFDSNYNVGAYAAGNLFNQQTGVVNMSTQPGNAWFPYEGVATTNRFVTIDLGASYQLSSIQIFNSNQSDRGTGSFSLSASNSVATGSFESTHPLGSTLSAPTMLISPTPLFFSTDNPATGQTFSITDGNSYRYLQITAISVPGSGGPFSNVGLAEVRVYAAAVPEPSTYAMLLGASALGCAMWCRRRMRAA